ncbi:hypothetical protein DV735_g4344, partial [Chaetothyriales sp. CBS 134920]
MAIRLPHSPATSAEPLAVARLDNFHAPTTVSSSSSHPDDSTVYGILYAMHPADEAALDRYEGHTAEWNPHPEPNYRQVDIERPFLQGSWVYNKHYLRLHVVKWLVGDERVRRLVVQEQEKEKEKEQGQSLDDVNVNVVRALVYVDEVRTQPGEINAEYIGRMNRAIAESTALGLPTDWVDAVIRPHVRPGVETEKHREALEAKPRPSHPYLLGALIMLDADTSLSIIIDDDAVARLALADPAAAALLPPCVIDPA